MVDRFRGHERRFSDAGACSHPSAESLIGRLDDLEIRVNSLNLRYLIMFAKRVISLFLNYRSWGSWKRSNRCPRATSLRTSFGLQRGTATTRNASPSPRPCTTSASRGLWWTAFTCSRQESGTLAPNWTKAAAMQGLGTRTDRAQISHWRRRRRRRRRNRAMLWALAEQLEGRGELVTCFNLTSPNQRWIEFWVTWHCIFIVCFMHKFCVLFVKDLKKEAMEAMEKRASSMCRNEKRRMERTRIYKRWFPVGCWSLLLFPNLELFQFVCSCSFIFLHWMYVRRMQI